MFTYTEIKGTVAKLSALARKHGFKYKPGDRVFRRTENGRTTLRAYRTMRKGRSSAQIFVERVRAAA